MWVRRGDCPGGPTAVGGAQGGAPEESSLEGGHVVVGGTTQKSNHQVKDLAETKVGVGARLS